MQNTQLSNDFIVHRCVIIKVKYSFRILLLILLEQPMNHKSPFTMFYNDMARSLKDQNSPDNLKDPRATIRHPINFQTNLCQDRSNKSTKRQTKIKVFGLSDKKRSKEDKFKEVVPLSIQAYQSKQKTQQDFNLLQSKTFDKKQLEKNQNGHTASNVQNKSQSLKQLHKLLGLSEEMTQRGQPQEKNKEQIEIKFSTVQKQQSSVSKPRETQFANVSLESMLPPSSKNSPKKEDASMSKQQVMFDKTQSRFLPSQLSKKQITPIQSKSNSRIIDLIASLSSDVRKPIGKKNCGSEEMSNKNSKILISEFSKISKMSSAKQSPVKNKKLAKENSEIIKVKSCQKQLFPKNKTQKAQHQTQQNFTKTLKPNQHLKPFVPMSKKTNTKNETKLGQYLNSYGSYQRQVQNLIDRFQKVKQLKQKQVQIKQQINKLTQKSNKPAYDNMKNYYFPEQESVDQRSQQNINLYYTNHPNRSYQQSEVSNHKKQLSYDSNPATDSPNPFQNQIQRELNRNVASMQKMIKKFKRISKNIQVIGSQNSSILKTENKQVQTNRRSLLQEHYYKANKGNKSSNGEIQSPRNNTVQPSNLRHLNLQSIKNELCQSQHLMDSREMTEDYTQADKKEVTLQQYYSTRIQDKRTSRTQKKYPNISNKKERQTNDQECKISHEQLLKQIKRLNNKIVQLEQTKQKKLSQVKSENTLSQMRRDFVHDKQNISAQQNQSVEQPSVDVSIPLQINQQSYCYQYQYQNQHQSCPTKNVMLIKENSKDQIRQKMVKQKKNKQHQVEAAQTLQKLKDNLNFPIFCSFPSSKDSLAQLIEIGSYMFYILYKFVSSRKNTPIQQLNRLHSELKVKKYMNFIHYCMQNELNYHLIYYFKGNIYFGQWHVDQIEGSGYKHGEGYYYHPQKYVYQGQFVFDKKEGYGYAKYTNGQIYQGEWRKNKKQGKGVLVNSLGDSYKGTFKAGKKHGKGREHLSNGDYYKGQFRQGKIEGQGKYVWSDCSIYKGQFKDGKLNGNGVWKSKQNDLYQGKFQDNKKQGEGVYKWNNGVMYAGYFMQEKNKDAKDQFKKNSHQQRQPKKSVQQKRSKTKQRHIVRK